MTGRKRGLTKKQRAFCHNYLETHNATESAKKAGYSERCAEVIGYQLLNNSSVKKWLDERRRIKEENATITTEKIEKEIASIAFIKPEDFILGYGKGYVVKMEHKLKALEMMCRIRGMFNDKMELSFKGKPKEVVREMLLEWLRGYTEEHRGAGSIAIGSTTQPGGKLVSGGE